MRRFGSGLFASCVLASLLFPVAVRAQRVSDLVQGMHVRVRGHDFLITDGQVQTVTMDSLTVVTSGVIRPFTITETRSIFVATPPNRARGMWRTGVATGVIGALLG